VVTYLNQAKSVAGTDICTIVVGFFLRFLRTGVAGVPWTCTLSG